MTYNVMNFKIKVLIARNLSLRTIFLLILLNGTTR
jgi:hypothetical protein